jgi:diaminopimelate epimerase
MTQFHKMHGLGNDFIILDERDVATRDKPIDYQCVIALSNRKTGIGCDQFIVLRSCNDADVFMHIINADGSEAGACGNATRCVAQYIAKGQGDVTIATVAGVLRCVVKDDMITVNMGAPRCDWQDVPLSQPQDTLHVAHGLEALPDGVALSVGNPHLVLFVGALDEAEIMHSGALLEQHILFPSKANISFAQIIDAQHIQLRTWERGAGLTLACGTGACATAVAARRRGLTDAVMQVHMAGGDVQIQWAGTEADRHHPVMMTGSATYVYSGMLPAGAWS